MSNVGKFQGATLYFHSPCFDGIVSCLLAWEFLERNQGWAFSRLLPVNYDRKGQWLNENLRQPAAVVDYLYHPSAAFWADHHQSTFLTSQAEHNFRERNNGFLLYDSRADSCSTLLWKRFANFFVGRKPDHAELVEWASRIDSARYASVEEAIFGSHPALQINASLAVSAADYPERLVRLLRRHSIGEVAALQDVQSRVSKARLLAADGLERFSQSAQITSDQIVLFDVECEGVLVHRYAPFYKPSFRDARYSVGITRERRVQPEDSEHTQSSAQDPKEYDKHTKKLVIKAMRNPWREFQSAPLGRIFAGIGGGGHERVGSYIVPAGRASEATQILEQIVDAIREYERIGEIRIRPTEITSRV